jgi:hypothetical protein
VGRMLNAMIFAPEKFVRNNPLDSKSFNPLTL